VKDRKILEALARARLEIDLVAIQLARSEFGLESVRIEEELKEARARVEAVEARVAVLEARG
jgi:hypothetical protein